MTLKIFNCKSYFNKSTRFIRVRTKDFPIILISWLMLPRQSSMDLFKNIDQNYVMIAYYLSSYLYFDYILLYFLYPLYFKEMQKISSYFFFNIIKFYHSYYRSYFNTFKKKNAFSTIRDKSIEPWVYTIKLANWISIQKQIFFKHATNYLDII